MNIATEPWNRLVEGKIGRLSSIVVSALFVMVLIVGPTAVGDDSEGLITEIFLVPSSLMIGPSTDMGGDPFAETSRGNFQGQTAGLSARGILENAGIIFPSGATALYLEKKGKLIVKNTRDQLDLIRFYLNTVCVCREAQIHTISEIIEVDAALYHDWMFENRITHDGTDLRRQVQKWIKPGKGQILSTSVVTSLSGNRSLTGSVEEYIYPTEMDPPEIPNIVDLDGEDTRAPFSACNATAFEVRNLGPTFELDLVLDGTGYGINMNTAITKVDIAGYTHWHTDGDPFFTLSMPTFRMMRVTTQVYVTDGRYIVAGAHKSRESSEKMVIHFLRSDVEALPIQ